MTHEPRIYFAKSTRSNALKIGTSADVAQRLRALQTQPFSRLTLLAEIPGDERYEKVIHAHFAEYRIKGEWFRLEGRLAEFVALLPSLPAHVRPQSRRRAKASMPAGTPLIRHPAFRGFWTTYLAMMQHAAAGYGVTRFAAEINKPAWLIHAWLHERGNHRLPADIAMQLEARLPRHDLAVIKTFTLLKRPKPADLGLGPSGSESESDEYARQLLRDRGLLATDEQIEDYIRASTKQRVATELGAAGQRIVEENRR